MEEAASYMQSCLRKYLSRRGLETDASREHDGLVSSPKSVGQGAKQRLLAQITAEEQQLSQQTEHYVQESVELQRRC